MDESGRPSPAPGLVPAAAVNTAPSLGSFVGSFTTNATAAGSNVQITYVSTPRPPDDDGLAGAPALIR